jgi:hypothetical protein
MADRGHYRCYVPKNFRAEAMTLITAANQIIEAHEAEGYSLTLRQLYYQFVAKGLLPNQQDSYNRLGRTISDARLAGLVSWTAIEDRTRNLQGLGFYKSPREVIQRAAAGYRIDLWDDQPWRPEVWVEKEALVGVVEQICNKLRVDFFACRGYNSQSEQWRAGQRFARYTMKGQRPIVFHLGDHDPSGIDMTRDNRERLEMFAGTPVIVQRLALNMPQIEELKPPPNPAKQDDSRFEEYRALYGDQSWELDALPPSFISRLIADAVRKVRDPELWDQALAREAEHQRVLAEMAEEFGA